MPKLKTHKGAKDRFMVTGSGKIMRTKGPKSHLRAHKSKRLKKNLIDMVPLAPGDKKRIQRLIPYGVK
jgi:large subunit ribosomal protein L35